MSGIFSKLSSGALLLTLSKEIYEKEAVMAAAYKFTDSCMILVRPSGEKNMEVVFEPMGERTTKDVEGISKKFCNEVLDQQIRLDLERRFGNIREVIVKHAFSPLKELNVQLEKP
jgi:His-Xaa-Ser system protein HxsD